MPSKFAPVRTLLVDDEPMILTSLARHLNDLHGVQISTASSGADALRQFAMSDHEVVVSDFRMPQMNGLELLSRMREAKPSLLALLYTGTDVNPPAGIRLLPKPTDSAILRATVADMCLLALLARRAHPSADP